MSLFREFKTDPQLENNGIPFVYTGGDGIVVFKCMLARTGGSNKKYEQVRERVSEPYRRLAKVTDEHQAQISRNVFAEAIIVKDSWQTYLRDSKEFKPGVETDSGEIVPATPEVLAEVMEQLPDLYEMLVRTSLDMNNYKKVALELDAKN